MSNFFKLILPNKVVNRNYSYINILKILLFAVAGIIVITEYVLPFFITDVSTIQTIAVISILAISVIAGICIIMILKGSKWQYAYIALFCLFLAGVGYSIFGTSMWGKNDCIDINENKVVIKGTYPLDIQLSSIFSASIENNLPTTSYRTDGMSLLGRKFGYFKMENGEKCYLYLRNNAVPVIHLKRNDDMSVYINGNSSNETIAIYEKIEKALKKNISN